MKTLYLIVCLALIASCKKETPQVGNVTFFQMGNSIPNLFVDGKKIGRVTIAAEAPVCGQSHKDLFVNVELPYGEHKYWTNENDTPKTITINSPCRLVEIKP